MKRILFATLAGLMLVNAYAQDDDGISRFTSDIRWYSAKKELLYGGPCDALSEQGPMRQPSRAPLYTITLSCRGYGSTKIIIWHNDLALVNGYPAKIVDRKPKSITLVTGQDETFVLGFDPSSL